MSHQTLKKGFTLIELLVVMSIILILTAIVTVAVQSNLKKSRDARRLADLKTIELGLEVMKQQYGSYPTGCAATIGDGSATTCSVNSYTDTIDNLLAPYMKTVPKDPRDDGSTYFYAYDSNANCTKSGEKVLYAQTYEGTPPSSGDVTACTCSSSCGFSLPGIPKYGIIIDGQ